MLHGDHFRAKRWSDSIQDNESRRRGVKVVKLAKKNNNDQFEIRMLLPFQDPRLARTLSASWHSTLTQRHLHSRPELANEV